MTESIDTTISTYSGDELSVRLLSEVNAPRGKVIGRTFFEGGDCLQCLQGAFRFSIAGAREDVITLQPGDVLFIYPGNTVAIDSLKAGGRLRYAILNGSRVDDFFSSFGFHDGLVCTAADQPELFRLALTRLNDGNAAGALSIISDALRTFANGYSRGRVPLVNAIRIISQNLSRGVTRLKPVYDEMKISRATLHRLFADNGLTSPGDFQRREQVRRVHYLLTTSTLSFGEIAARTGISSSAAFTDFSRRFLGKTPSEIRKG